MVGRAKMPSTMRRAVTNRGDTRTQVSSDVNAACVLT
jgi:hypothetical protein